ncbi:ABC transporter ATP-binding protein [Aneurinibacillus aneurinilyticus]|uniref:ABC transporter ATP-binding protein n=2 Tax=Aneurinibacillus aneurinilyticus TaxID=1391 RepID=A0A848CW27_ANEAE|nr:ABC transporter ATP-binding protein [Aneurinibacillus aneurinilyticus]ERI08523.1 dipeptide ABC transporter, ATP-binding protein DppD [Aneurinibacillus aneurinilyticus ATCC 12856]MCI1693198.1 ABC transporter ATP-binding protein [Aneurinibacillus aneurinilyticus]MED0671211.1 ABC transporter ATP-binding protein [Aneurinibacillus aneurinilyticus]MED0704984.1 ABC transporter ATP-binding protein [Aneurinibacillus aneurinilyticus]MED0721785.1 ABC transporter ATP-binding protein [Aneurinibacillus a
MEKKKLLEVEGLRVSFQTHGGTVQAVRGVSFSLHEGETLAVVGESGCGKSVTARSIMRLIPEHIGRITEGHIRFQDKDLTALTEKQMRELRGSQISMIFQDSMTALNPTITIGEQIMEGIIRHQKVSRQEAREQAVETLKLVGIANPESRLKQYLHQFSGGMRQRIMIAIAFVCRPKILIADEPTTALDVTIQAQILDLFKRLQEQTGVSIIMITHDLGVVAKIANRVNVMYAGQVVESGAVRDIFYHPQHPYTRGLLGSMPRLDSERDIPLKSIPGTPPDLFAPPQGCAFAARCEYALEVCGRYQPETTTVCERHRVACWLQDPRAKNIWPQRDEATG